MSNMSFAHRGYAAVQKEVKSDKAIELQVFMSITAKLRGLDKDSDTYTADLFSAIIENQRLWRILFIDLVSDDNKLPLELKTGLLSLAEFTQDHSRKVMLGQASHDVLIDINMSIIGGLRQSLKSKAPSAITTSEAA